MDTALLLEQKAQPFIDALIKAGFLVPESTVTRFGLVGTNYCGPGWLGGGG